MTFPRSQDSVRVDLTLEAGEECFSSRTGPDLTVRRHRPAGVGSDAGSQDALATRTFLGG